MPAQCLSLRWGRSALYWAFALSPVLLPLAQGSSPCRACSAIFVAAFRYVMFTRVLILIKYSQPTINGIIPTLRVRDSLTFKIMLLIVRRDRGQMFNRAKRLKPKRASCEGSVFNS
jgi:hypothetical protein